MDDPCCAVNYGRSGDAGRADTNGGGLIALSWPCWVTVRFAADISQVLASGVMGLGMGANLWGRGVKKQRLIVCLATLWTVGIPRWFAKSFAYMAGAARGTSHDLIAFLDFLRTLAPVARVECGYCPEAAAAAAAGLRRAMLTMAQATESGNFQLFFVTAGSVHSPSRWRHAARGLLGVARETSGDGKRTVCRGDALAACANQA